MCICCMQYVPIVLLYSTTCTVHSTAYVGGGTYFLRWGGKAGGGGGGEKKKSLQRYKGNHKNKHFFHIKKTFAC